LGSRDRIHPNESKAMHGSRTKKRRAVFFDALLLGWGSPNPNQVGEDIGAGLARLYKAGYQPIVVSNQPEVALGRLTESDLRRSEGQVRVLLAQAGVPLTGFYYCPHHPEAEAAEYAEVCACRKPRPGMLHRAARDHGIDLAASWMIGDVLDDVEAGYHAGCRTVLITTGGETEWRMIPERLPDLIVDDLAMAADGILTREESPQAHAIDDEALRRRLTRARLEVAVR
jgi:D,D-heptose 1,7-bisphosphate phosphatase